MIYVVYRIDINGRDIRVSMVGKRRGEKKSRLSKILFYVLCCNTLISLLDEQYNSLALGVSVEIPMDER